MKILKFQYKNILSYGNVLQEFKFSDTPQLILVEGENGSGKSSIKEALTVGLYGKSAIRQTKDIPNWINRNAYTNVEFLTQSGDHISITRGIDPNYSNIEINGDSFNLPDKRKVDDFVENELANFPFTVFCNTVSLSFDDFKSFVSLNKSDKRKIVDRIFGIDHLSEMQKIVKEDLKETSNTIDILNSQIQKNKNLLDNSNHQLSLLTEKIKNDNSKKLEKSTNDKINLEKKLTESSKVYLDLNDKSKETKIQLSDLTSNYNEKKFSLQDLNKKLELYQKNRCPHCLNDLTSDLSINTKNVILNKIKSIETELIPISEKITKINESLSKLESEKTSARSKYYEIEAAINQLTLDISELENKNSSDELESIQNIIKKINDDLISSQNELSQNKHDKSLYSIVSNLLSDNGIKKDLLNKIIPTLNSRINVISERLDFKFNFEFNDQFDPVISYLGMEISSKSLSSGQRKKMNLIVLLAFIEIIKMKHNQLNLLFLDEIFSSLDKNNVHLAIQILKEYSKKYNITIFVVSHEALPEELFDSRIFVKSVNHFSEMEITTN